MLDQTASGNMVVHRRVTKSSSITGQPPHTSTVEGTGNLEFDSLGRCSCILIIVKPPHDENRDETGLTVS